MKISIFTTSFLPHHSRLGISNASYLIAKNLIEKHDCVFYVYSPEIEANTKETENHENLHIKRFPCISRYKLSPQMLNIREISNSDLVHSYHYGFFPAFAGLLASKKNHMPHTFTTAYHPPIYTPLRAFMSRSYDILQGFWILKYSNAVFPFNNDERRRLEKYVGGNYDVIPCPINSKTFYPERNEREKITIGYVGPMLPWKGAKTAFDIFQQIERERSDARFVFVGAGFMEDEIKAKASKNFTFLKDLPPKELAKQYNSIDILVSPTYYESFGCVLAEAGMCGTPIIATKVGGVPETVGDGGIMVDYGGWNNMKEQIERLIDDAPLRKKLGRNAIRHTGQFKDEIVSEKIYKVYKKLLNS